MRMLDYLFLVPIGDGIPGNILPNYLRLQTWCDKNNSQILTCHKLFLNFARNYLATQGGGFTNPQTPRAKWVIWIDSDVTFNIDQIEDLVSVPDQYKFCSGWYRSALDDHAMCGKWDVDYFEKHKHMPFFSVNELTKIGKEKPESLVEADFTGFGFTKLHTSILEEMTYPYFTLNVVHLGKYTDMSFEDVSFCQNCARETGIKPFIVPRIRVGHYKSFFV